MPNMLNSSRKTRDSNALKCDFLGCHSRATFKRKYELQRHMKKHERKETYPCPAIDCDRKGSRSFYRVDKLSHHLRTGHGDNDSYLCPLAKCLTNPMSFDEMKLHASSHVREHNPVVGCFLKIPTSQRQCMLKNCLKRLNILEMQSHLLDHTMNERLREATVIRQMGYDAETVKVICPLCKLLLGNHEEFAAHLQSVHLITDSAHLAKFQKSVANTIPYSFFLNDLIWETWRVWHHHVDTLESMLCPTCGQPALARSQLALAGQLNEIDHHLQLLVKPDEIRPYRGDILRLFPRFGSHPVFDDVRLSS
jgi:hypothetical protein